MIIPEYDTKLPVLEAIVAAIPDKKILKHESVSFVCV